MSLKPLGDRVLVRAAAAEEKTQSGIIIADTAKEKPQKGEVIAVGKGTLLQDGNYVPSEVQVGDTVVFAKYAGTELKLQGEEYLLLEGRDILAILS